MLTLNNSQTVIIARTEIEWAEYAGSVYVNMSGLDHIINTDRNDFEVVESSPMPLSIDAFTTEDDQFWLLMDEACVQLKADGGYLGYAIAEGLDNLLIEF